MNILLTLRIALRALAKNKLRAGLTVLGVVIGIAAVTTMVSIGQSAAQLVRGQLESFGTNVIVVFPQQRRRAGVREGRYLTLTKDDAVAVGEGEVGAVGGALFMILAFFFLFFGWALKDND